MNETHDNLILEISKMKLDLREREASLPAHSIRPHQLLIIEELEEKIRALEEKVRLLDLKAATKERP